MDQLPIPKRTGSTKKPSPLLTLGVVLLAMSPVADIVGKSFDLPLLFTLVWFIMPSGAALVVLGAIHGGLRRPTKRSTRPIRARRVLELTTVAPGILIFLLAWWLRGEAGLSPDNVLIGFQLLGLGLLWVSLRVRSSSPTPAG